MGLMAPFCERVEIAGSIRRRKHQVKDIEIVAIPKWYRRADPEDLFGAEKSFKIAQWIKPGAEEIESWAIKPDGKYWRGLYGKTVIGNVAVDGLKVDIFLAAENNFGLIYALRTGSAEFSKALVTHAANIKMPCIEGYLTHGGAPIHTPEERDVFDALNLKFIPPEERIGESSLAGIQRLAS